MTLPTPNDALIEEVRAMVERLSREMFPGRLINPDGPDAAALITRLLSTASTTPALGEE